MTTLLIDGDIIAYQAAAATEIPIQWDEDLWTLHCTPSEAYARVEDTVASLMEKAGCDTALVCLTSKSNFRKEIDPEYKANRNKVRKPTCLKQVREFMVKNMKTKTVDGLEADDLLGIFMTKNPDKYIMWSIDKDLKQIAGRHLTEDGIILISEEEAEFNFWMQVLTGDQADNYKGIQGVGPVKAERILKEDNGLSYWGKVKAAYEKAGLTVEDAIITARLAHILRHETKDILWEPPSE